MQFACNGGRRKLRNPNPKLFRIDNRSIRGHSEHFQGFTCLFLKSNAELRRNMRYTDSISLSVDVGEDSCRDTKVG